MFFAVTTLESSRAQGPYHPIDMRVLLTRVRSLLGNSQSGPALIIVYLSYICTCIYERKDLAGIYADADANVVTLLKCSFS